MPDEYTPTTVEVCECYAWWHSEQQDGSPGIPVAESKAAFHRWLAGERARVWDEAYEACRTRPRVDGYLINRTNPHRQEADR